MENRAKFARKRDNFEKESKSQIIKSELISVDVGKLKKPVNIWLKCARMRKPNEKG